MDKLLLQQGPHNTSLITGGLAFILTALYVVLMFPVFYRAITQGDANPKLFGLLFFIATIKSASWLVYLWPIKDLFVMIGIMLEMIGAFIFLLQAVWVYAKNKISDTD